jgi:hypothetical protein
MPPDFLYPATSQNDNHRANVPRRDPDNHLMGWEIKTPGIGRSGQERERPWNEGVGEHVRTRFHFGLWSR